MYEQATVGLIVAHQALPRPTAWPAGQTTLAFTYLVLFRRVVVSLAALGAVFAWAYEIPALAAALVCIGIGEFLESSYYLNVMRWRQVRRKCSETAMVAVE